MSADQWVDCLELVSRPGDEVTRCSLPAEIILRQNMQSTNGTIVHVKTRCVLGHILFFPAEILNNA
jgi:hypothetical protein